MSPTRQVSAVPSCLLQSEHTSGKETLLPGNSRQSYHPGLGSLTSEGLSILCAGELGARGDHNSRLL